MNSSSKSPGRAERRVGARSPAKGVVFPRKSFETQLTNATRNESAKLTSGWFIPKSISDAEEVMMNLHKTGVNLADKDYVEGIINGKIVEMGYVMGISENNAGLDLYGDYGDYPIPKSKIPIRLYSYYPEPE